MGDLKKCDACGHDIAKDAKKCPHCGKDNRNFFMKHKIISAILVIFVLGILASALNGTDSTEDAKKEPDTTNPVTDNTSNDAKNPATNNTGNDTTAQEPTITKEAITKEPTTTTAPSIPTYSDGTYLVNKDIPSGLYKVTLKDTIMKMGYIERSSDVTMEMDSIIANIILTGDGYVELLDTDMAVKLQGVEIQPIDIKTLKPNIQTEVEDGIYLIGYDLAPGTYKVEVTDTTTNIGYVERSKSVAMGMNDIIANELFQGPGYVKIQEGDFAVRLQGVKITFQE